MDRRPNINIHNNNINGDAEAPLAGVGGVGGGGGGATYAQLQFRRIYRYGLCLLLAGVLCNWIGFAQYHFAPLRYLGVACVLAGVLCICAALCRWLTVRHIDAVHVSPFLPSSLFSLSLSLSL